MCCCCWYRSVLSWALVVVDGRQFQKVQIFSWKFALVTKGERAKNRKRVDDCDWFNFNDYNLINNNKNTRTQFVFIKLLIADAHFGRR